MSLLGLLESLDYSGTEVDLFVFSHQGELMKWIPKQVNLLPEIAEYKQIERPIKDVLKKSFIRIALARLRGKRRFARYDRNNHPKDASAVFSYVAKDLSPLLPNINPGKEYDIAVSYLTPHNYVLDHVRAKEKVAWIHTDYSQVDVDTALELPVWAGYDKIVSISPDVTIGFLRRFPSLSDKIVEKPNLVPSKYVKSRAEEMSPDDVGKEMPKAPGRINLLSVGRFCYAKNYDNVPDICRRIREKGIDVYWYLIGYGGHKGLIKKKIAESGMEEYVRILGKKENPYPYMKACDFYVQPSRFEGMPMTVLEAVTLGKPVIITDFPTARSVVGNNGSITIVPFDNTDCATAIANKCKSYDS